MSWYGANSIHNKSLFDRTRIKLISCFFFPCSYKICIFAFTFITYMIYHMGRKVFGVVEVRKKKKANSSLFTICMPTGGFVSSMYN